MKKKAIILANGDLPTKYQLKYFQKMRYNTLICADGGANSAKKLCIVPDYIIGDLDSITEDNLNFFAQKSIILRIKRQNDTDVEKSLKFLIKNKYTDVLLLGATGDRLDHSICNLGIVFKFYDRIKVSILHKKSYLHPYSGSVILNTIKGETVSLYGLNEETIIISKGLKYCLKNESLPFGLRESTSNIANASRIELLIKGGVVLVIRDFKTMVKNDLF